MRYSNRFQAQNIPTAKILVRCTTIAAEPFIVKAPQVHESAAYLTDYQRIPLSERLGSALKGMDCRKERRLFATTTPPLKFR
jgi:hypothetical protein